MAEHGHSLCSTNVTGQLIADGLYFGACCLARWNTGEAFGVCKE